MIDQTYPVPEQTPFDTSPVKRGAAMAWPWEAMVINRDATSILLHIKLSNPPEPYVPMSRLVAILDQCSGANAGDYPLLYGLISDAIANAERPVSLNQ